MKIGFDIISDLNVINGATFNWENRVTSLYCIICGNISSESSIIASVLKRLSSCYMGVFYIAGLTELQNIYKTKSRHTEILDICKTFSNVIYLQHHVIIVEDVAIVGAVGWNVITNTGSAITEALSDSLRLQDYEYLKYTIDKLQIKNNVRNIILVTPGVPDIRLYFGTVPENIGEYTSLSLVLQNDTQHKITHWIYSNTLGQSIVELDGVNFICNSNTDRNVYRSYRIDV